MRHVEKNCRMKGDDRKRSLFCWYHPNDDPPQRTAMQRNCLRDNRSAEKKKTDNDKTTRRSRRCTSCPISTTTIIHHHSSSPSHLVNHPTSSSSLSSLSGSRHAQTKKKPRCDHCIVVADDPRSRHGLHFVAQQLELPPGGACCSGPVQGGLRGFLTAVFSLVVCEIHAHICTYRYIGT